MAMPDDELAPRRPAGRVPPHNPDAERSLLGAMLLSRDAIATALETVRADDFHSPAHGHVFDAIASLYGAGEAVDPVTVAEELRRAGLLDEIGGPATLVSLQAATPAISSASRYGHIVEEHALLRRLIGVAGEIAEIGYGLPDDVTKAVDRAESLVFEVAQRRVTDSLAPIRDLLTANLDRLEQLYERGESITGVPTGYSDLDELLSGLQGNALYVVGARPAMGKALELDTPIPTPGGWTTMGELRVGDRVLDESGRPTQVTYVSPIQHDRECFEVEFDDGTTIVADAEHQWFAYDLPAWKSHRALTERAVAPPRDTRFARDQSARRRLPRVVTTREMLDEGVRRGDRPNWYVPLAGSLDLPDADLPADPYVLGCWLGDGRAELAALGDSLDVEAERTAVAQLVAEHGPQIPAAYMRASHKQRLALLQGLLDTDGTVTNANGTVELCLADLSLLEQAHELVCSLGHKPGPIRHRRICLGDGREAEAWRFRWTPLDPVFRMERKAARLETTKSHRRHGRHTRRSVVAIRPRPSVPVRCITVDSPSHLYLAGASMVPTHNTAFALGMATHAALESQRPVLFFSLEMSQLELTQRIVCAEARVDSARVRNGKLVESDWTKIAHSMGRLAEAPIWIDDNPNLTIMEIRSKARRLKSRVGDLGMVVVDYLQLMTGRSSAENRQVEVSEISRGLKILARELETPVVALSQLSRSLEMRQDKRPVLADLRESGSIEQDADVVMFIYRDEIYHPDSPDRGTAEILVSKHRNGPTGTTRLAFLDHYTRFANMAKGV